MLGAFLVVNLHCKMKMWKQCLNMKALENTLMYDERK